jgi:hypothetical protein
VQNTNSLLKASQRVCNTPKFETSISRLIRRPYTYHISRGCMIPCHLTGQGQSSNGHLKPQKAIIRLVFRSMLAQNFGVCISDFPAEAGTPGKSGKSNNIHAFPMRNHFPGKVRDRKPRRVLRQPTWKSRTIQWLPPRAASPAEKTRSLAGR